MTTATVTKATTVCSCGCGTVVMVNGTPTQPLTDRFIYEFDGTLDYIELFVAGHDRQGLTSTFRSRAGGPDGPRPWGQPVTPVKPVKVALVCQECGKTWRVSPKAADPQCPKCGSVDWEVKS